MRIEPVTPNFYKAVQTTQNDWRVVGTGGTHYEAIEDCLREVVKAEDNPTDDDYPFDN